jgi:hypothetical protein
MNLPWNLSAAAIVVATWFLVTGLWCLITKKPLIFPARYKFWLLATLLSLYVIPMFPISFGKYADEISTLLFILVFLIAIVYLLYEWKNMRGYIVMGITNKTFQHSLRHILNALELPFEESLSRLKLTTVNNELQVTSRSWLGENQFKLKELQHTEILEKIADSIRDYFATSLIKVNVAVCILNVIIALLIITFVLFINFP